MTDTAPARRHAGPTQTPLNVLRGFLIGMAELVPGVSGGTVALVTGVYERALLSLTALGAAFRVLVTGPDRTTQFAQRIRQVEWWLVGPALVGMVAALLFAAGSVAHLVETHPENARGLFFGLVVASLVVPIRMLPKLTAPTTARRILAVVAVVVPAVVSFVLVGFASGSSIDEPQWWFVFLAASIAICALVVPGVSGSFFLLAIGLYAPTLGAVHDRDWGYLGVFAAGALLGLLTIVKGMTVLLHRARRATLLVAFGLMLGSLRALWPWQGGDGGTEGRGTLLPPSDPLGPTLLAVLGAVVVTILVIAEARVTRRVTSRSEPTP